jgi:hypothetical protein
LKDNIAKFKEPSQIVNDFKKHKKGITQNNAIDDESSENFNDEEFELIYRADDKENY